MPIRLLPDGTIETDTISEFGEAIKLRQELERADNSPRTERVGSVDEYKRIFPKMWDRWSKNVRHVLLQLYVSPNGKKDRALKNLLGYTAPGNYQLAGTLQAIGKVAKRYGAQYQDVIIFSKTAESNSTYLYELTAQTRAAMAESGLTSTNQISSQN